MPQSLCNIAVHLIFSTKDRVPFLDEAIRDETFAYLAGTFRNLKATPIEVGGHTDHVHALITLPRTDSISHIVGEVKSASSKWLKNMGPGLGRFSWQAGYAGYSVSQKELNGVRQYIQSQEEHHRKWTFQDELRAILREQEMEFDEKYVWQ